MISRYPMGLPTEIDFFQLCPPMRSGYTEGSKKSCQREVENARECRENEF